MKIDRHPDCAGCFPWKHPKEGFLCLPHARMKADYPEEFRRFVEICRKAPELATPTQQAHFDQTLHPMAVDVSTYQSSSGFSREFRIVRVYCEICG